MPISVFVLHMGTLELKEAKHLAPAARRVGGQNWAATQTSCLEVDLSFPNPGGLVITLGRGTEVLRAQISLHFVWCLFMVWEMLFSPSCPLTGTI